MFQHRSCSGLALAGSLLLLYACGDSEPRQAPEQADRTAPAPSTPAVTPPASVIMPEPGPRVADTFAVGDHVYVRSLALEPERNALWVGTSTGLLEVDLGNNSVRNTFTRDHGLANEYVFGIFVDSQGYKWFGTNAGGVSRYRDGEWKVLFPMHGLADYWIYSFAEQAKGPLWIGTWAGVNSVDLDTLEMKTYVKELINEWVYAIDIDSADRVWFGTEGGISLFDGDEWRHWTHEDGLGAANLAAKPASANTGLGTRTRHSLSVLMAGEETYNPNYVFSLKVDHNDHVWAGTWGGGVGHYDGERWRNLTSDDGLAGNIVYSMAIEKPGVFWFGTNHGLNRWDGKTWLRFDRSNGMLDDNVYAIAIAPDGSVWAGTRRGVARIAN
jgi:ligand-binding sensor domain-containing protein